jgi:hypothetical protein
MSASLIVLFIAGAMGALAKDVISDNQLQVPKKLNGNFCLGFCGGMLAGGFVGMLVDNNPTTAFFAGYSGTAVLENLLAKPVVIPPVSSSTVELLIRKIAAEKKVDPELAVLVAKCESGLNPLAKHTNILGSVDRGLYQINSKYHPEVSDTQAFDPEFSINFFCDAVIAGKISMWSASQKCWDK